MTEEPRDAREPRDAEELAERIAYAPETLTAEQIVERLRTADSDDRLAIARGIGRMAEDATLRLSAAVPYLVETLDADSSLDADEGTAGRTVGGDRNRRHLLDALATIAARDGAAVRPHLDRVAAELDAYNMWVGDAAVAACVAVVERWPAEFESVTPYLEAREDRVQVRALRVLAAAASATGGVAVAYPHLQRCVELCTAVEQAREPAVDVFAAAGWSDPETLVPIVGVLLEIAEEATDTTDTDLDAETRVAALTAVRYVATYDPGALSASVPRIVGLTLDDGEEGRDAAASVLATLAAQDPATVDRIRASIEGASYFEQAGLVRRLARATTDTPGRDRVFAKFLDVESPLLRETVIRAFLGPGAGTGLGAVDCACENH